LEAFSRQHCSSCEDYTYEETLLVNRRKEKAFLISGWNNIHF